MKIRTLAAVAVIAAVLAIHVDAGAQEVRRFNAGLLPVFYLFDEDYFGIGEGGGADLVLRYEITNNIFIENRLGAYGAKQGDVGITGLNGQIAASVFFPVWIPYRPSARLGLGILSANPVVSDPIEEFRPSQTLMYLVVGVGMTRSIRADFQIEGGVDLLFTPYRYNVYKFYRQYYEVNEARFSHIAFYIGASYIF